MKDSLEFRRTMGRCKGTPLETFLSEANVSRPTKHYITRSFSVDRAQRLVANLPMPSLAVDGRQERELA